MSEVERLRAKKKQIYEDLKDAVDREVSYEYDEGYRAGMQKMREVGQARIDELEAKREWVGLTDQEILDALGVFSAEEAVFRIARAVETKLKEKNT
jgi:hypothetical protein